MLDLGFEPQILKILLDIRPDRQTGNCYLNIIKRLITLYYMVCHLTFYIIIQFNLIPIKNLLCKKNLFFTIYFNKKI